MDRVSTRRRRLQNAFVAAALGLCAAKAFAVEVEGPGPRSGPAPVIAPLSSRLPDLSVPALTDGVAPQIDAALKPTASIEASSGAGLDITNILQGRPAGISPAPTAVLEPEGSGLGSPALAPSRIRSPVVSETITPAPVGRNRRTDKDPGARVLQSVAILTFLAASVISWYVFIHAVGDIFQMGEQQLQEQLHDPDLGNNPF